jgi:1-acyl-sn-glycerol-3-phosphate acyltransferase
MQVHVPSLRQALSQPLDDLNLFDRALLRGMAAAAAGSLVRIEGAERIAPERDPFILAMNHTCRREALLVPAVLVLLRRGRRIHMLADWNFKLIPFVSTLYARSGAITVDQKRARPRWLEVFRPWLVDAEPAHTRARAMLAAGRPVGLFPEGTVNRNPTALLRGRRGAAQLAVETGAPVVPAGLRRSADGRLTLHVGAALAPMARDVEGTHARLMQAIATLSGKSWSPRS